MYYLGRAVYRRCILLYIRRSDLMCLPIFSRVRALMVRSGKCSGVGNVSGRGRESLVYFVPDSDFPTPSPPRSLFLPIYRPDWRHLVPAPAVSRPPVIMCVPDFPAPPPDQLIPSNADVRTQFLSSRNSLMWKMFPLHLPLIVQFFPSYIWLWMQLDHSNLSYCST